MLGVYVERVTGSGVACGTVNLTTPKLREEKLELILKSPAMALSVRGLAAWLFMLFFQASYVNFQPVLSSSMSDISSNSLQTSIASPQHFMSQTTSISISILVHAPPPPFHLRPPQSLHISCKQANILGANDPLHSFIFTRNDGRIPARRSVPFEIVLEYDWG